MRLLSFVFLAGCAAESVESSEQVGASAVPIELRETAETVDFDVSDGRLGDDMSVSSAEFRATIEGSSGDSAEMAFDYRGDTTGVAVLASGARAYQVGLKLRAVDTCNVVYVMWRKDGSVAISAKINPGKTTHEECGANGYKYLAGGKAAPLEPGSQHVVSARVDGAVLTASFDGVVVQTTLPDNAAHGGRVGLRSDNAAFSFSYSTK